MVMEKDFHGSVEAVVITKCEKGRDDSSHFPLIIFVIMVICVAGGGKEYPVGCLKDPREDK